MVHSGKVRCFVYKRVVFPSPKISTGMESNILYIVNIIVASVAVLDSKIQQNPYQKFIAYCCCTFFERIPPKNLAQKSDERRRPPPTTTEGSPHKAHKARR